MRLVYRPILECPSWIFIKNFGVGKIDPCAILLCCGCVMIDMSSRLIEHQLVTDGQTDEHRTIG